MSPGGQSFKGSQSGSGSVKGGSGNPNISRLDADNFSALLDGTCVFAAAAVPAVPARICL